MRAIKFRGWHKKAKLMSSEATLQRMVEMDYSFSADDVEWLQFTGLHDKNGKEIYEGDIVYIAGLGNCCVKWEGNGAYWMFESKDEDTEYQFVAEDLEGVIGNIYENPELLEGGE